MEKEGSPDLPKLCAELLPYCTEEEKKQLEQLRGIFQSMEMYREMSKTMDMMKDIMPDMSSFFQSSNDASDPGGDAANAFSSASGTGGGPDIINMLMNMLTPEQREMFHLFGGNNHE